MPRKYVFLFVILCVINIHQLGYAIDKKIASNDAEILIGQHFAEFYQSVHIGTLTFELAQQDKSDKLIRILDAWQRTGLITYKKLQIHMGLQHQLITELTEKGRKSGYITKYKDNNRFGFLFGKREVLKIVEIMDDNTILFGYRLYPSEYAYDFGYKKDTEYKYRGKAVAKYDPFLEKYVFKGALFSPWEREEWGETTWTDMRNGKKVFISDIEK